ncbi:MAG: glycosyltransferase [Candidatus Acidiferrales bacterium]
MGLSQRTAQLPARIGVCVATYKRGDLLRRLLAGVSEQRFHKVLMPEIAVVVVDNDASRSAEQICRAARLPWPLKYVVECHRGIAQARNRAIRESGDVDFIAFIDDDEVPTSAWLDELLSTQARFGADVVCGPVLPSFAAEVPDWVKIGGFFDRAVRDSGSTPDECRSGNALIRTNVFARVSAFDERFGLTGGEDTQFFLRVRRAGYKIVSSAEACVYEAVPISRANLKSVLRRAYQSGNSWVLCESSLDRRISTRIVRAAKACGWIVIGTASACVSPLFGMATIARSLRNIWLGAGMLTALAGQSYHAYESAGTDLRA